MSITFLNQNTFNNFIDNKYGKSILVSEMEKWELLTKSIENGDHYFTGHPLVEYKIKTLVSNTENVISKLINITNKIAKKNGGIQRTIRFYNSKLHIGLTLVNRLTQKEIKTGKFKKEQNYISVYLKDDLNKVEQIKN